MTYCKAFPESSSATHHAVLHIELYIVVSYFAVTFGRIIVAEDFEWTDDLDSLRFGLHKDEGVAFVRRGVRGVRHGEHDVDGISWITSSRDPLVYISAPITSWAMSTQTYPFVSIYNHLVALDSSRRVFEIGSIG